MNKKTNKYRDMPFEDIPEGPVTVADDEIGEIWDRVVIEPRVANHLYGEKWREYLVNTGQM